LVDLGLALRALGFLVTGNEVKELRYKYDPGKEIISS
jgi:hypothetical protein